MPNNISVKINNIEATIKNWPANLPNVHPYKGVTLISFKSMMLICFVTLRNEFPKEEVSPLASEIEVQLDHIQNHLPNYTNQSYFNQCVEGIYNINKLLHSFGYLNNRIDKIVKTSLGNRKQAQSAFNETIKIKDEIKSIKAEVDETKNSIDDFYTKCLGDENDSYEKKLTEIEEAYEKILEENGYFENIQETKNNAEEAYNAIAEYKEELLDGDSENESIKQQIHDLNQEMLANQKKMQLFITEYITGTTSVTKSKDGAESTTTIKSKKQLVDDLHKSFQNHIDDETKKIADYNNAFEIYKKAKADEIEGLLKSATNASLASAFEKHRSDIEQLKITSEKYFFYALIALVAAIFIPYIPCINNWMFNSDNIYLNLFKKFLFTGPFIWLAYHQSKKSNQYFRLEQEYAHKAVVSRSFEGYKSQVLELYKENSESQEMLKKLLGESINTIAKNPAEVLDSVKATNHPIQDLKENLTGLIDPLTKLIESIKKKN